MKSSEDLWPLKPVTRVQIGWKVGVCVKQNYYYHKTGDEHTNYVFVCIRLLVSNGVFIPSIALDKPGK